MAIRVFVKNENCQHLCFIKGNISKNTIVFLVLFEGLKQSRYIFHTKIL